MPLWGNLDTASGNQKPLFANTSNAYSNSTINGTAANTNTYYGNMYGVSAGEEANAVKAGAHSGWVSQKIGTGPVSAVTVSGGAGINANGFLVLTDTSYLRQGVNANVSFVMANTQNTLERFSTNPTWNGVGSVTIVNGGSGYSNVTAITVRVSNAANTTQPTVTLTLGGRAGRIQYETIVATGSITGDDARDNVYFVGV
tara:strand:- start:118 stop:717 length:600 start_codon:yes stop_codon:yes gene_type:complete